MKPMKPSIKVHIPIIIGLLLSITGCGGSDDTNSETIAVAKLLVRSSSGGSQQALVGVGGELAGVRAAGVAPRSSGCYILPTLSPDRVFWLIIDVPAEQLSVLKGLGYQSKESARGPNPTSNFIEVNCSDL